MFVLFCFQIEHGCLFCFVFQIEHGCGTALQLQITQKILTASYYASCLVPDKARNVGHFQLQLLVLQAFVLVFFFFSEGEWKQKIQQDISENIIYMIAFLRREVSAK